MASQLADELGVHNYGCLGGSYMLMGKKIAVAIFTPVLMRSVHGEELHPAQVVTPLEKRMFMRWFVTD